MKANLLLCLVALLAAMALVSANSQCTQVCTYGANYEYACVCCTDSPGNTAQTPDPNVDYNTCMDQCNNYYCPGYSGYKRQSERSTANFASLEIEASSIVDAAQRNQNRRNSSAADVQPVSAQAIVPVSPAAGWAGVAKVFGAEAETSIKAQYPNGCSQSCGVQVAVGQQELRCLCPVNAASQAPSFTHFSFVKKSDGSFQCNNPEMFSVANPPSIRDIDADYGQAQCEALGCACGFIVPRKLAVFRRWKDLAQDRRNVVINRAWNTRVKLSQLKVKLSQHGLTAEQYRELRQEAQSLKQELQRDQI